MNDKKCIYESEGYCGKKEKFLNPQECDDCKMHEFTLHSADKYKDGTPMMKENKFGVDFCEEDCCPHWEKNCGHTLEDKHMCPYLPHDTDSNLKYLEQTFKEFAKVQDELIEEYDATLKTHGDTLEVHMERIKINEGNIDSLCLDVEDLQRKVYAIHKFLNSVDPDFFAKIEDQIRLERANNGSNFCGNCAHCHRGKQGDDTIYVCDLTKGFLDPDDSSCSMFEPPF